MTKEEREAKRLEIQQQVEEFLKSGGRIVEIPMGACSDKAVNYNPQEE